VLKVPCERFGGLRSELAGTLSVVSFQLRSEPTARMIFFCRLRGPDAARTFLSERWHGRQPGCHRQAPALSALAAVKSVLQLTPLQRNRHAAGECAACPAGAGAAYSQPGGAPFFPSRAFTVPK